MNGELLNIIKGALYGVAAGDALGAPLEFMSAAEIRRKYGRVTEMTGGGWLGVRPGEVTDDTQMTLAVAEGIAASPDDPVPEIGRRFISWYASGPKDVGGTCASSIAGARSLAAASGEKGAVPTSAQWFAASAETARLNGNRSGGNGGLMRTVYPGLYYRDLRTAVQKASDISRMTHWDEESDFACRIYTEMIHALTACARLGESAPLRKEKAGKLLENTIYAAGGGRPRPEPTGYSVDSMMCAVSAVMDTSSLEDAVIKAANLGGDADTIAAIAGGLAGAVYGYRDVPGRWIRTLQPLIRERLDALAETAAENRAQR